MNIRRLPGLLCLCLLVSWAVALRAPSARGEEKETELKDRFLGRWEGVKGAFAEKHIIAFEKYKTFAAGTAGDYTVSEIRVVTDRQGKKSPVEIVVGKGSYSIDGTKLTFTPGAIPGPIGKEKVTWEVTKATKDALILTTDKNKAEEFKKKP
jgi:hypothetical protein